jgi:hypothetical protein
MARKNSILVDQKKYHLGRNIILQKLIPTKVSKNYSDSESAIKSPGFLLGLSEQFNHVLKKTRVWGNTCAFKLLTSRPRQGLLKPFQYGICVSKARPHTLH